MTTDRELLERAAKAAGLGDLVFANGADDDGYDDGIWKYTWRRGESGKLVGWNPLTDDGDALRLAVKLRIHAKQFPILDNGFDVPLGMVEVWRVDDEDPLHVEFLRGGADRLVATRRAIVRAAAEIGKELK